MVVVIRLEVIMAFASGRLNLCIPFDSIEPVVPKLSAHYLFIRGKKEASPAEIKALRGRLNRLKVPLTVILGQAEVSVNELLGLEVGDYITLDTRVDGASSGHGRNAYEVLRTPGTFRESHGGGDRRNHRVRRGGRTMSDGILSQDELNALLGGEPQEGTEEGGEIDAQSVGEILRLAMGATAEGLAIMIGEEGRVEAGELRVVRFDQLNDFLATPRVLVQNELAGRQMASSSLCFRLRPSRCSGRSLRKIPARRNRVNSPQDSGRSSLRLPSISPTP